MKREIDRLAAMIPPLCLWYESNRKSLPWREDPSPYHVWISEIMLQQTRIEAVIPYYKRFLTELPTVEALAEVDDDRLMKLWQGLGYYSRARNLKKAASAIVKEFGGVIPSDPHALRSLPGIGDYTAGAIASIAFGQPCPAVDGNVLRVIMRLCAKTNDIMLPATKRAVTEALETVYPQGSDARLLTEGLMELGETVCIPSGAPHCEMCPLRDYCQGYADGVADSLPVRNARKDRRIETRTVLLLTCGGKYALLKRPATGLLASLWELPNFDGHLTEEEIALRLKDLGLTPTTVATPVGKAKHIFSHVEWHMIGFRIEVLDEAAPFAWADSAQIRKEYAIPTAFRHYTQLIL
ncbi:MAG: A/G-specific adenine glycosylase [Clostridia bacterium]|nr:A/G-specific adenine glycosylase [Clostridia bacterium]